MDNVKYSANLPYFCRKCWSSGSRRQLKIPACVKFGDYVCSQRETSARQEGDIKRLGAILGGGNWPVRLFVKVVARTGACVLVIIAAGCPAGAVGRRCYKYSCSRESA